MPITPARAARFVRRARFDAEAVEDPRAARGRRHSFVGMLRLLVLGFVCGKSALRSVEELCERLQPRLRKRLGLLRTVSDTAFYELLSQMDPKGLRETVWRQVRADLDAKVVTNDLFPVGVLSMDGKGAGGGKGPAPHEACRSTTCDLEGTLAWHLFTVRACLTSSSASPVIHQDFMTSQDGEATMFPKVFAQAVEAFPRLFEIVTYDAGGTSKANAQWVLDHGKHYVFAFKASYPQLFPKARELLGRLPASARTCERANGVTVTRELRRVEPPDDFVFPGVHELWSVTQTRTDEGGNTECEERIFVTSLDPRRFDDEQVLRLVRMHWRIENNAHWTFDMVLREDTTAPCTSGAGTLVVSWLRILAYNLLSGFRAHLPRKEGRRRSWSFCRELANDSLQLLGVWMSLMEHRATPC